MAATFKNRLRNPSFDLDTKELLPLSFVGATDIANSQPIDAWFLNKLKGSGGTGVAGTLSKITIDPTRFDLPGEAQHYLQLALTDPGAQASGSLCEVKTRVPLDTLTGQHVTVSAWLDNDLVDRLFTFVARRNYGTGGTPSPTLVMYAERQKLDVGWRRYAFSFSVPPLDAPGQALSLGTNGDGFLEFSFVFQAAAGIISTTSRAVVQPPGNNTVAIAQPQFEAGLLASDFVDQDVTPAAAENVGTVTSFSAGSLAPLFTTSVSTATSTPALNFLLSVAGRNLVLAGPTGAAGAPAYRALVAGDIPTLNQNTTGTSAGFTGNLAGYVTGPQGTTVVGKVKGVIDGSNAAAGDVGEVMSAEVLSSAAVPLVTSVAKDIATLTLTAGDWDVRANIAINAASGTTMSAIQGWVGTASATMATIPNKGAFFRLVGVAIAASELECFPVGIMRISVSTTTTIYLTTMINFAVSTASAYGYMEARRVR